MKMTDLEFKVIKDNIFESTTASDEGYTEDSREIINQLCWLGETKEVKGKTFSGVISSLNQKGFAVSLDQEVISLTEKGFDAYQEYRNKNH